MSDESRAGSITKQLYQDVLNKLSRFVKEEQLPTIDEFCDSANEYQELLMVGVKTNLKKAEITFVSETASYNLDKNLLEIVSITVLPSTPRKLFTYHIPYFTEGDIPKLELDSYAQLEAGNKLVVRYFTKPLDENKITPIYDPIILKVFHPYIKNMFLSKYRDLNPGFDKYENVLQQAKLLTNYGVEPDNNLYTVFESRVNL